MSVRSTRVPFPRALHLKAFIVALAACLLCPWSICHGQEIEPAGEPVARVGKYAVHAGEVEAEFHRVVGQQQPSQTAEEIIRRGVLNQLVKRQLVMNFLKRKSYLPNESQLQIRMDLIDEGFQQAGSSLELHLAERKISLEKFGELTSWNLGWNAYLDRHATDENIRRFFQQHQTDFDGTQLHVAHVLITVNQDAVDDEWDLAIDRLDEVRQQVLSGETDFATAAAEHSQATTAKAGGDIGWIERRFPMPEAFSKTAFQLEAGETSKPVRTIVGVHLIHCLAVEAGNRTWLQCREQIVPAMKSYLFDWIAEQESKRTPVQYLN